MFGTSPCDGHLQRAALASFEAAWVWRLQKAKWRPDNVVVGTKRARWL